MDAKETIVGVVLAGGQSSRMGGGDKCLQPLGGKPMLAHVVARLGPQVSRMVISVNGDLSRFATLDLPVVADSVAGFQGPLAGIEAGLVWAAALCPGAIWAVSVPGDTPFIPDDLVRRLAKAVEGMDKPAVAASAEGVHPVVGLWPVAMAGDLEEALAGGLRRVSRWAEMQGAAEVFFPPSEIGGRPVDPFFNINRPEDFAAAEALLMAVPTSS